MEWCERPCDPRPFDQALRSENRRRPDGPIQFDESLEKRNREDRVVLGADGAIRPQSHAGAADIAVRNTGESDVRPGIQGGGMGGPRLADTQPVTPLEPVLRLVVTYRVAIAIPAGTLIDVMA